MRKISAWSTLLGSAIVLAMYAGPANAQATRTWVSGVGDDVNPCSRTAPCKTFAGAISKTAASGEINCLDPGGFGGVTIGKNLTIACDYTEGGILASLTNGVNVNGNGIVVVLRGLDIEGAGNGLIGVNIIQAARVHIDKCVIHGFRGGSATGILVNSTTAAGIHVDLIDTWIGDNIKGITTQATAGFVTVSGDRVTIVGNSNGVETFSNNNFVHLTRSLLANNSASALIVSGGNGHISLNDSSVLLNGTGINAASTTGRISISNNNIYGNATGFNLGAGAQILSTANNRTADNGGATFPNGSIVLK